MKFALETHRFAPELNTLWLFKNSARQMGDVAAKINVPGVKTIAEARAKLFKRHKPHIVATIRKTYPEEFATLNREWCGVVHHRKIALDFARDIRGKEQGGPLIDGRTLPAPTVTVSTKMIIA
jgi:hypothetical protein